jgi:VIT1/CCC1 family predicted Fe2+/Mn2+ transporter
MEGGERSAVFKYQHLKDLLPETVAIQKEEEQHEFHLLNMIDEKSLHYLGSIVLGLNDALVELTGVLAGLTFGFQDTKLVAFSGLITGIAAAMSMAGSEYLSTTTENNVKIQPLKAALYTGIAYIGTVVALIFPYFICSNIYVALGSTITIAIAIIALFNFYAAIAQGHPFKKRFLEMVAISLGVAVVSF